MVDAMTGLATGRKANKREQTVLTPQPIVDVCNAMWGRVELDPCHAEGSIVGAKGTYSLAKGNDGLNLPWFSKTYINPPYSDLKAWLAKGEREAGEQIWLIPVRTNRSWWLDFVARRTTVWLKGFPFLGHTDVFPVPLCLVYRGGYGGKFLNEAGPLGWTHRIGGHSV